LFTSFISVFLLRDGLGKCQSFTGMGVVKHGEGTQKNVAENFSPYIGLVSSSYRRTNKDIHFEALRCHCRDCHVLDQTIRNLVHIETNAFLDISILKPCKATK